MKILIVATTHAYLSEKRFALILAEATGTISATLTFSINALMQLVITLTAGD